MSNFGVFLTFKSCIFLLAFHMLITLDLSVWDSEWLPIMPFLSVGGGGSSGFISHLSPCNAQKQQNGKNLNFHSDFWN